jgi:hypothetical protein
MEFIQFILICAGFMATIMLGFRFLTQALAHRGNVGWSEVMVLIYSWLCSYGILAALLNLGNPDIFNFVFDHTVEVFLVNLILLHLSVLLIQSYMFRRRR